MKKKQKQKVKDQRKELKFEDLDPRARILIMCIIIGGLNNDLID